MRIANGLSVNRHHGLRVPLDDVPAHLACGWRVADVAEPPAPDNALLLVPPKVFQGGERS